MPFVLNISIGQREVETDTFHMYCIISNGNESVDDINHLSALGKSDNSLFKSNHINSISIVFFLD